jgi:hypothetical protein
MKTTATSVLASVKLLLEGKYIVWVKDRSDSEWEPNGDGPMTQKDADRVVRELRGTCRARALPVGMDLPLQAQHRREESGPPAAYPGMPGHQPASGEFHMDPAEAEWTKSKVVNCLIGATTALRDVDPIQAIRYLLNGLSREQLIAMYNERCGMDHDGIIAAIERTR